MLYNGMTNCIQRLNKGTSLGIVLFMILTATLCVEARAQASVGGGGSTLTKFEMRSRIDFNVNLTNVDGAYHGNDEQLAKVLAEIDSVLLNPHMRVGRITVVGTASPEGPYKLNQQLAEGRARTFVGILQQRYTFPDSIYAVSTVAEDWEGMRRMLSDNDSIPYANVVLKLIDESAGLTPEAREQRLRQLGDGHPYRSMRDNVFPYLRRATLLVDGYAKWPLPVAEAAPGVAEVEDMSQSIDSIQAVIATDIRRRFFAIKTNLLGDVALCANLGVELELWPRWSIDVPVWYSPYDITDRWRIRLLAIQPEVRYWLKEAGQGHYFGVHATVAGFNVSFDGDYRYQDPNRAAYGFGIGYGFAFHLDRAHRWGLEAQIGAGYIDYQYVKYKNTGRNGAEVSRKGGTYWGITRAGVTLSYKFYCERKGRRWMQW